MKDYELARRLHDYPGISEQVLLREILKSSLRSEEILMTITEALATLDTHATAATNQIRTHLQALHDQIDGLTKQVADLQSQDLPPDVQAKVDALAAAIDAIDVPDVPVTPTPPPPPDQPPAPPAPPAS